MNRYVMSSCVPRCIFPAVSAAFLMILFSADSIAAQIAYYRFTGQSLAPTSSGLNNTASNISGGIVGNAEFFLAGGSEGDFLAFAANFVGTNQTDAVTNGKYISFTITPESGMQIAYDNLIYREYVINDSGSGASGMLDFRWSLDSFAAPIASRTLVAAPNLTSTVSAQSFFSGTSASPVEFRIYFSATSNSPSVYVGIDSIALIANVTPIPEPGSLGLLLLGGGFLALRSPSRAARETLLRTSRIPC